MNFNKSQLVILLILNLKTLGNVAKNKLQNNILSQSIILLYQLYHPFCFRSNLIERIVIMSIDEKIRDGKLRYDIDREASKILALSSRKSDKYEQLKIEEKQIIL